MTAEAASISLACLGKCPALTQIDVYSSTERSKLKPMLDQYVLGSDELREDLVTGRLSVQSGCLIVGPDGLSLAVQTWRQVVEFFDLDRDASKSIQHAPAAPSCGVGAQHMPQVCRGRGDER